MRRGITLLEVVIILLVGVVAVGVGVMLITRNREYALREQCKLNLKRIGEGIQAYHDASSVNEAARRLPPSRIAAGYATWAVLLAPYLTKEHVLQKWDEKKGYFEQADDVRHARLVFFFCPTRHRADTLSRAGDLDAAKTHFPGGLGDYACVAGDGSAAHDWTGPSANGPFVMAEVTECKNHVIKWQSRTSLASLTRGLSYTLLVGEKHVPADQQGEVKFGDGSLYNGQHPASFSRVAGPGFPIAGSIDAPFNNNFGSYHSRVCMFLLADMSARVYSADTNEIVLGQMARRGE
ncbi:MAG: DUF1559 domain-containing protein [Planctomycetes bacterium]|nr:DUF1559 domain-containing protein [Planctomycetota bacterium]